MLGALNHFFSNALFLYPQQASENRKVFWCFQWVEKGYIGNKWVNVMEESILSFGINGHTVNLSFKQKLVEVEKKKWWCRNKNAL